MANSGSGWFGPQIDLSEAPSHVGGFVQLLVFVHRSVPLQFKLPKGGEVIRIDIQVGDDTRPRFTVSLWQKQMGSLAMSGDVVLLQNIKIVKFGDVLSARTVQKTSVCQTGLSNVEPEEERPKYKDVYFHSIWIIMLKLLLQQGKNSPLKFEANVNTRLDIENGRFELVSLSMPLAPEPSSVLRLNSNSLLQCQTILLD